MHSHIRQLSLQLYYLTPTPSGFLNQGGCSGLSCAEIRRAYATVSSESMDPRERPPRPLTNLYPYPKHPRPTPHQIFHLRASATQAEIKARYYELVKSHHPDSQHVAHLESDVAHSRFRTIQASYDFLRGHTISPHPNARPTPSSRNSDPYVHELARRRRAYYAYRSVPEDGTERENSAKPGRGQGFGAPPDQRTIWHEDGWRERLVFSLGVAALLAGLFPSMPSTIASTFLPTSSLTSPYVPPLTPFSASDSCSTTSTSSVENVPPSNAPFNSFSLPFSVDLDKGHRKAVSALVQARAEREELGTQRRDSVRKRVREMMIADSPKSDEQTVSREDVDVVLPMVPSAEEVEVHSKPSDPS